MVTLFFTEFCIIAIICIAGVTSIAALGSLRYLTLCKYMPKKLPLPWAACDLDCWYNCCRTTVLLKSLLDYIIIVMAIVIVIIVTIIIRSIACQQKPDFSLFNRYPAMKELKNE